MNSDETRMACLNLASAHLGACAESYQVIRRAIEFSTWVGTGQLAVFEKPEPPRDTMEVIALLQEVMNSRAPDLADAAHKGWSDRAHALMARLGASTADADEERA